MSNRKDYNPGSAQGAQARKEGPAWTLVITRELRHSPEVVWRALTDPAQLREWAPFEPDTSLGAPGSAVKLSTVGTPQVSETIITRADPPKVLEYSWGGNELRWQLEPLGSGTRLTLWHNIDRRYIAWGAAGWHICLDVLESLLAGSPLGRMAGPEVMNFEGWRRLSIEYAKQFAKEE